MFSRKMHISAAVLAVGVVCLLSPLAAQAAEPIKLSGAIGGVVTNSLGAPQMGASVVLYNRQDRAFDKVLTDERGEFRFLGLFPDLYSVRVSLATFVPALKKDILVQPGMRSILNVNLNSLFSSIQIGYPTADSGSLMTDDWKWILRSASATRPVMRFAGDPLVTNGSKAAPVSVFSDTRGVLQFSGGDGPMATGIANQADMGTAFALATSIFGNNLLEVSGNLGYGAQTGVPMAAFRTSYSRAAGGPEFSVTMRQLFLPDHFTVPGGSETGIAMLRSVSASVDDRTELTDNLSVRYGFTLDSISFGDRLNTFSPYARLAYAMDDGGVISLAFTSGNARPGLGEDTSADSDLQRELNNVGMFPRLSVLNGRPKIQRGNELELTYARKVGSRKYEVSAYRESVTDAALSITAPESMYAGGDLLPDLFTGNGIFNAGDYHGIGYSGSVTQDVGDHVSAALMYGTMNGLTAAPGELTSSSPDELRSMIRAGRRQAATARITATSPWTGTRFVASYQWSGDHRWVLPGRLYTTDAMRPLPGFNVYVRQPIPVWSALPWRMEARADLSNLLAQGYLPFDAGTVRQVVLVQNPRSFRGGLSFIF
ncbi:MAG TPA: carboxypeptidase-like regulatory domain-containing protein [Bryobacteraceae bacterium]|jgi:hypothetical protein|nr:carboxypeptidase-like regulatory domain-containing protein [Bryobacteraceae bacterium]